jgi:hypothetical protein
VGERRRILKGPLLPLITFPRVFELEREREVRLCDVFLESPAVGLLGLRIFELPTVGLSEFHKQFPGRERAELFGKG